MNREMVGRSYAAPEPYEVSREVIRRFAEAIADSNPLYLDAAAARSAGHPDVIAPPTFLTVLSLRFAGQGPVSDPALGLDYSRVVHGEQRFVHHRPVCAGDWLNVSTVIDDIRDAGANELMVTRIAVTDAADQPVSDIYSTLVSRGTAAGSGS